MPFPRLLMIFCVLCRSNVQYFYYENIMVITKREKYRCVPTDVREKEECQKCNIKSLSLISVRQCAYRQDNKRFYGKCFCRCCFKKRQNFTS